MPIYEYACAACGHLSEALQKMGDEHLRECPACRAPALERLMSAAGIKVKAGRNGAAPACGAGACPACLTERED